MSQGHAMIDTNEQVEAVLAILRRHLLDHRNKKTTGKLNLECSLRDGGVTDKLVTTQIRER